MFAPIEIIAVGTLLIVAVIGLVVKAVLRQKLNDIEGVSDVFESIDDEGSPVAKL